MRWDTNKEESASQSAGCIQLLPKGVIMQSVIYQSWKLHPITDSHALMYIKH